MNVTKRNKTLRKLWRITGNGLIALCLCLSVASCASVSAVQEFSPCQHPIVDVSTQGGMSQGLLAYYAAVEQCNAINGLTP